MKHTCALLLIATVAIAQPPKDKGKPKSPFDRWEKTIQNMEKADKKNPPPEGAIQFCGSSSIVLWDLKKSFPKLTVVKRGFGGSQIADSTHFAARIILPYKPKSIVFYAGDNDIAGGKKPEKVHEDFQAFVKAIHDKLPNTKIIYIAIKPSIARWKLMDRMKKANALIEATCKKDAKRLVYLDVVKPMLGEDGKPRKELFVKDGLHMSTEGYKVWTKLVAKELE